MFDITFRGRRRVNNSRPLLRLFSSLLIFTFLLVPSGALAAPASVVNACQLKSAHADIQHVIFLIFDNVHFLRDNPNVPSDLEQMPHLLNFIRSNGTLLTNDHTVLISHTANGILTNLTGMYSDRHGQAVANSYRYFRNDNSGLTNSSSSFKYWTDGTDSGNPATDPPTPSADTNYNMVNADSGSAKNAPAPWVPYTKAGCDFGATALANVVLENNNAVVFAAGPTTLAAAAAAGATNIKVTSNSGFKVGMTITIDAGANAESATISIVGTGGLTGGGLTLTAPLTKAHASGVTVYGPMATDPAGDMTKVFGENSPEWLEGKASQTSNPNTPERNLAQTDFVGIAIHCAKGTGSICSGNPNAKPDQLPDEPGGYGSFMGLFGAKYVNPAINHGSASLNKLNGQPIADQFNQPGFPGFDGLFATTTLSYVAQMQEAGIPVTFGYISDAHDQHGVAGEIHATRGPGEADYVQQLAAYDQAFGQFFNRLAADGINKNNTLFVFTVEEGDHFAGSAPTNPGCDGVTTPCTYSLIGEVNANLAGLMAQDGVTAPFTVHSDMAPTIYLNGNPARDAAVTRTFGRTLSHLNRVNPYTGQPEDLTVAVADPVGMKALHMITADSQRTPTLTMFAAADWFLFATQPPPNCNTTSCITVPTTPPSNTFAWNHGGIQPEIATTWLGIVGPGIDQTATGQNDTLWADHADVRPTMLSLVGLKDTYTHDGRILSELLSGWAVPSAVKKSTSFLSLSQTYKQLNAPFGQFATDALMASTKAIKSGSDADDSTYTSIENQISSLTTQRDTVAAQMRGLLDNAAFNGQAINSSQAQNLIQQAQNLMNQMHTLAQ